MFWFSLGLIIIILGINYSYYKITKFKIICKITDKSIITRSGKKCYIIYIDNNKKYVLDSCIWEGVLSPHTDWIKIRENKNYKIYGYGYICSILNLKQKVYKIRATK